MLVTVKTTNVTMVVTLGTTYIARELAKCLKTPATLCRESEFSPQHQNYGSHHL